MHNHKKKLLLYFLLFSLNTITFAQEKKIEGNYFSIYYPSKIEPFLIAERLEFSSPYLLQAKNNLEDSDKTLARIIDALFLEVSDILDIHLYSFKGNLKIFYDFQSLEEEFYKFYKVNLKTPSFYVYETNTIYISLDNLRVGILGHEIAHAIINNYFIVPPPTKIQEVLAGYVEYTLGKKK